MFEPLDFQRGAVEHHVRLLRERGASAEASVAGAGKTFIASFIAKEMGHALVVCCPKVVIPHWQNASKLCGAPVRSIANYERHKLGHTGMGHWRVKNRTWAWDFPKPSLLVIDEAHYCKTRTSQNAKLIVAAKRQGIPTLVMSATLAVDPTDLYATGYLLGLHDGDRDQWQAWQARYGVIRNGFAFEFCPRHDPTALRRLHADLFPARGHRKTYAEIPGFPDAVTDVREVEGDEASLREIDTAWQRTAELEALKEESVTAITMRLRARQIAELAKLPEIIDLARDLIASGLSVPIFLNFKDSVREVARALKCDVIDGDHDGAGYRDRVVADFQADRTRALAIQIDAGGIGISLHDTHGTFPRHSLICPPENPRALIQALGRNRRVGQKSPAFRSIITLARSVEARVKRNVEAKVNQIEEINGDDLDPAPRQIPGTPLYPSL